MGDLGRLAARAAPAPTLTGTILRAVMAAGSVSSGRVAAVRPRALVRGARKRPDLVVLAAMLLATLVTLAYLGRDTLPLFDDWIFWSWETDYSPGVLLEHYNGHASPVVKAIWFALTDITGGSHYLPFRLFFIVMHVATLGLFYFAVAPRIGRGLALVAVLPLTLMGIAWLDYVMPISGIYQVAGPLGIVAAIVALDRGTRRGDVLACLALTAMAFTAVGGVAAVAGVYAYLLWERPQWRRLWVAVVPTVLFAAWWLVYRPEEGYEFKALDDISLVPSYVADGLSHGIRTYTYLPQEWAVALAVVLLVAVVRQFMRPRGVDRALVAAIAAGVAFWAIVAIGRGPDLRIDQLRYLYPNAIHAVLIAALVAGLAGLRSNRRTVLTLGVLSLAFFIPSANQLRLVYRGERSESLQSRAAMTAEKLALDRMPPAGANPFYEIRKDHEFTIERYRAGLALGRDFAYDESEIPGLFESQRKAFDQTSLSALGVKPLQIQVDPKTCKASPVTEVPSGGSIVITNRFAGGETVVFARRYADQASEVGKIAPKTTARIEFPRDRSDRPWQVFVNGVGVNACTS